jgi:uncharacterized protein YceK
LLGVWIVVSVVAPGCSSIKSRGDSNFYPGVYPGLKYHQTEYRWGEPRTTPHGPGEGQNSDDWRSENYHAIVGVIDFPFTLVFDTVLLPWDLPYSAFHKPSTNTIAK